MAGHTAHSYILIVRSFLPFSLSLSLSLSLFASIHDLRLKRPQRDSPQRVGVFCPLQPGSRLVSSRSSTYQLPDWLFFGLHPMIVGHGQLAACSGQQYGQQDGLIQAERNSHPRVHCPLVIVTGADSLPPAVTELAICVRANTFNNIKNLTQCVIGGPTSIRHSSVCVKQAEFLHFLFVNGIINYLDWILIKRSQCYCLLTLQSANQLEYRQIEVVTQYVSALNLNYISIRNWIQYTHYTLSSHQHLIALIDCFDLGFWSSFAK